MDSIILELAAAQHGVVGWRQLRERGVSAARIVRRVEAGWLRRVHRGVYSAGALPGRFAPEMAAALACGAAAFVSHGSAASLAGFLPRPAGPVSVTCAGRRPLHPGVRIHYARSLPDDEVTRLHGIPATTPTRTLLDLAATAPVRDVERAFAEAFALGLSDERRLRALLERYAGRPGVRTLRIMLDPGSAPKRVRSSAESALLELIRRAGLPDPDTNVRVRGFEVDFFWPASNLVVEVDGYRFHSSRRRFETDRSRDAALVAAGLRVFRVTWRQISAEPERVVARITEALVRPVRRRPRR